MRWESSIAGRFSAAANTYDREAFVQRSVADKLLRLVDQAIRQVRPERILEVGCGTGVLTRMLGRRYSDMPVLAFDISETMVARARASGAGPRVLWAVADARAFRMGRPAKLIVSSSSLHWISPLDQALMNLRECLADGGQLVCAMMAAGTLVELHEARLRTAPAKRARSRLRTAAEIRDAAAKSGLEILYDEDQNLQVTYESAEDFLSSLHELGLTGGPVSSSGLPLTRGELDRLADYYNSHYATPGGGVQATYHVVYLRAGKAAHSE